MDPALLADWVIDARRRTLALYADLTDAQLAVPYLHIINPPIWELGHLAWFQEYWVLRRALGGAAARADADALWDSAKVPHATRWSLPLPSRAETLGYLEAAGERVLGALREAGAMLDEELRYFVLLSVFHEDMHGEAFAYTRQTLGWPAPCLTRGTGQNASAEHHRAGPLAGDVTVPGGVWRLGAEPEPEPSFVFDNEKWAHDVEVRPFRIARAPVTQAEFAAFVDEGGYRRRELWSEQGWAWRQDADAGQPLYWRRGARGSWERRVFDRWVALEPHRPVLHVCAHEAEAYCHWAGRRLPTEAEWEMAAAGEPEAPGAGAAPLRHKRTYPWGQQPPGREHANLDLEVGDTVDVGALPDGDSAFGCRQMLGNVWEWTASAFLPYPGFSIDPYEEYSAPWFGDHRVLRGGCFVTRARLLRTTWRNFYTPDRRDVWAGFRTCDATLP
jgi:iron(II)-dependent oxidoreductase